MNETITTENYDEINLLDFFYILWSKKKLIFLITLFFAISSVFFSLSVPNVYQSKAVLSAVNDTKGNSLGAFSGVAAVAGINLPGESSSKSSEAIARIKSFDFFSQYFLTNINLEDLVAVKKWDINSNELIYNKRLFDIDSKKWKLKKDSNSRKPSEQDAYEIYRKRLSIVQDTETAFITISYEHHSPTIAQDWLNHIIKSIDKNMRAADKVDASNSINFLIQRLNDTKNLAVKEAISMLIKDQMQKLMMVEGTQNFVFKEIDSPRSPEKKSGPNRALICIIGTIMGAMLSILLSLYIHYFRKTD